MITPDESAASLRFREKMNAHYQVYQEQIQANKEAERVRANAARKKQRKLLRDWKRVVDAAMKGL